MNKIAALTIVSLSLGITSVSLAATPEIGKNTTAQATPERAAPSEAWRFKLYQGRWWYWLPSNRWAVYESHRWLVAPEESLASRAAATSAGTSTTETAVADAATESGSFVDDYPAAPEGPESARQAAEYHLAVGKTYNRHADEHARILEKYAALGETVPAGVVKDHARAIRHDLEQSQTAFSRLAKVSKDNPEVAEAVERIQHGLRKVTESVRKLEGRVQRQDAVQAEIVRGQTAEVSALLNNSYSAAQEADREFYDMHSDDYYTSGEGHFVD